jgi:hypothetical protein
VPQGQSTVQGEDIRLGDGSADVTATHTANVFGTTINVTGVAARTVIIGHTLPRGTHPVTVVLDGRQVHNYTVTQTNRGAEVTVPTTLGAHTLTITS